MPTGDGLLVRLMTIGTIQGDAFVKFCAAAQKYGNGVVEITARGSIQVRGLSAASAPRFADAIAGLGIAEDGVPVLSNPLAGLDPEEIIDAGALAADLRRALARGSLAARLAPKVSVVIDGGGLLDLEALAADVRLCAQSINGNATLRVSVGGDGARATIIGAITPAHGVEAAVRLLEVIAARGRKARARDLLAAERFVPFRAALLSCPALRQAFSPAAQRETTAVDGRDKPSHDGTDARAEVIGLHQLRDGSLACGLGLAFGHCDALSLEQLTEVADAAGASGFRAAPGRVLIAIGLTGRTAPTFTAAAEQLGFIVRTDDPRRHVSACAGAPICASAHMAARAMAPAIAAAAAPLLGDAFTIHVSGCVKGCARPSPAGLTIVGTPDGCALIANGSTRDAPYAVIPANELSAAIAGSVRNRECNHG